MGIPFLRQRRKPPAAFQGRDIPYSSANIFSKSIFQWIAPFMAVGWSRPVQPDDLWTLTEDLQCQTNADTLEANFNQRLPPSKRIEKFRNASPKGSSSSKDSSTTATQTSSQHSIGDADFEKGVPMTSPNVDIEKGEYMLSSQKARNEEIAMVDTAAEVIGNLGMDNRGTDVEEIAPRLSDPAGTSGMAFKEERKRAKAEKEKAIQAEYDTNVKLHGKKIAAKIKKGTFAVEDGKKYDMSLVKALWVTFADKWYKALICSACGVLLQTTAPIITRLIISQVDEASAYAAAVNAGVAAGNLPPAPRSVGYGIGLAVALFVMEMAASLFNAQAQQRGMMIGFLSRSSLIDLIARKSMRLSGKSRIELPNGRLTTMVSADCSFLDFAAPMSMSLIIQPLQILVGIALLLWTLGYSALVGLAILIASTPLQGIMFVRMITYRQAQMKIVDTRVRLLTEVINNIRAVKLYAYEVFFGEKVSALRRGELAKIRRNGLNRATMNSSMTFVPILAAVLTFITYSLSGHDLNPAIIFSGLQFFNILKQPLTMLPMVFTACSDAAVAITRIGHALRAEELVSDLKIDKSQKMAIKMEGDFEFDSVNPPDTAGGAKLGMRDRAGKREKKKQAEKEKKEAKDRKKQGLSVIETKKVEKKDEEEGVPFSLRDIALHVPRGSLVCIVGRVGTGKTTLLSAMINEVRQIKGEVVFGGKVSYVPQHAWVQGGTIKENITFYAPADEADDAYIDEVIDACALRPEMDMWADGSETKIGEKGITLSGGQRQRVCLARAAYDRSAEIVLLDDPLSAVDAHVGHHILHKAILSGPFAHKTRVLVTHHLDVLPHADLVLVMDKGDDNTGRIIQQGLYEDLRQTDGVFRKLMEEYGSAGSEKEEQETKVEDKKNPEPKVKKGEGAKFLLDEEREIGAVSWGMYGKYLKATDSWFKLFLTLMFFLSVQAASVTNTLFLGFWSDDHLGLTQGAYMGIYAALGVAVAIFTWAAFYSSILACLRASYNLFNGAWAAVLRAPVGWHDRTPTGRIINRLSKDIEMLDDRLSMIWNSFITNSLSVVGTFALIVYAFPYLGLVFIPLGFIYYWMAAYYRATSREVKRVDSLLRSYIYSSFGEQLAGVAVIRAFGQQTAFKHRLQASVNNECAAYMITITIQQWLAIRLNLMSYLLVMLIAIFAAVFRTQSSAAKIGVTLTYSLSAASVFSQLVQMFAQLEQEMNNVERVQYYNDLEVEASRTLPSDPKKEEWPTRGQVEFQNVELKYRPELPLVLKGLSFSIRSGEKVGIIGRTGAGKSSIAQALLRTVELSGGKISVDGVDLKGLGIETLRSRLAIIPQDAFLFAGTVRENIDPTGQQDDTKLQSAIDLIHQNSNQSSSFTDKFKLDATVLNEGGNYSAGERQLLSLLRALVRGCKVLLLDEATSSVDPETDAVIQRIIQTEFSDITLISIAHRLQTVAYYDRILVMDQGTIAEFDSPLALFDTPGGIFRSLCDTKMITRDDLVKIQTEAARHFELVKGRTAGVSV